MKRIKEIINLYLKYGEIKDLWLMLVLSASLTGMLICNIIAL